MIASGILLILCYASWQLVRNAIDYYHSTNATLEAQRAVLISMNRLSKDLAESHRNTVVMTPAPDTEEEWLEGPPPGTRPGILFATPRTESGGFEFDPHGRLIWQAFLCYYVDEVAHDASTDQKIPALIRVRRELSATEKSVIPPDPVSLGLTVEGLSSAPAPDSVQVVGRWVANFQSLTAREVTARAGGTEESFGSRVVQVEVLAKTFYRTNFAVEAETSVLLRN